MLSLIEISLRPMSVVAWLMIGFGLAFLSTQHPEKKRAHAIVTIIVFSIWGPLLLAFGLVLALIEYFSGPRDKTDSQDMQDQ